jgi:hypothetical protein
MSRILFIIRFIPIYHITNKRPYILNLFFQIYMQMENDRSCMYKSSDVLAHFNRVSLFLETAVQHAIRQKEEAIYCPCKIYNNHMIYLIKDRELIHEHLVRIGFMDNYFIWSKNGEKASLMRYNRGQMTCIVIITVMDLRMILVRMISVRMMQVTVMKVLMWRS